MPKYIPQVVIEDETYLIRDTEAKERLNEHEEIIKEVRDISCITKNVDYQPIATVEDAIKAPLEQLKVKIEPIQDLHGYDKPWVGGTGKNLLNAKNWNETISVVTYKQDGSGMVDCTGTSNNASWYRIDRGAISGQQPLILPSGNYIVSATGLPTNTYIRVTDSAGTERDVTPTVVSQTITSDGTNPISLNMRVQSGVAFGASTKIYCMVRSASETDETWEPYFNICPISGWTGAKISVPRKNLIPNGADTNNGFVANSWINSSGVVTALTSSNVEYVSEYFKVKSGATVTYSQTGNSTYYLNNGGLCFYDKDKNFLSGEAFLQRTSVTITVPNNAVYCRSTRFYESNPNCKIQLEYGSSATSYEPFDKTYSITFPSAAGTVYGGTLTVNQDGTGTVAVDKLTFTLNGSEAWSASGTEGAATNYYYTAIALSNNKFVTDSIISNMYPFASISGSTTTSGITCLYSDARTANVIYCRPYNITNTTVSAFKTDLSSNNLQAVCGIETPIIYTLTTDQVIYLLNGYNVVYADCGDISFDYYTEKYATKDYAEHTEHFKANSDNQYVYKEASGSVIEIADGAGDYAKQVQIGIEPVQDLHGFDAPWVGGAGKNLIPIGTLTTIGGAGLTASLRSDGTVKIIGTASETGFYGWSFQIKAGTYILNGCPDKDGCSISLRNAVNGTILWSSTVTGNTETQFTVSSDSGCWITMRVENGTVLGTDGVIFEPMVRLSTITNGTYAPYTNICPISGWDKAEVTIAGKNLLNEADLVDGCWVNSIGNIDSSSSMSTRKATVNFQTCRPNTTYFINASKSNGSALSAYNIKIDWYDKNKNHIGGVASNCFNKTINSPSNAYYFRVGGSELSVNHIWLNFPSSETGYSPFTGCTTYTFSFPQSCGTVYGGTLTMNQDGTGSLVVDRAVVEMSGFNRETNPARFYYLDIPDAYGTSVVRKGEFVCDKFNPYIQGGDISNVQSGDCYFGAKKTNGYTDFYIHFNRYDTADSFNENVGTVTIAYKLATPITYSLTEQEVISLLSGYNTVYSDCGETTILYPSEKYLTLYQTERERIHESDSVSASVKTITDGADNAPIGVKIAVEPVQDLHGYSNPWVGGAGKNLCPNNIESQSINDLTVKRNTDGTVTITGTASATTRLQLSGSLPLENGSSYYLNGCASDGSANTYMLRIYSQGGSSVIATNTSSNDTSFTYATGYEAYIVIVSGTAMGTTGKTFAPMIRKSTEADNTYIPYENLCPISGWDKAEVTRTGKNLFDPNVSTMETLQLIADGSAPRLGRSFDSGIYTFINRTSEAMYYRIVKKDLSDRGTTITVGAGYGSNSLTVPADSMLWVFKGMGATTATFTGMFLALGASQTYEAYKGTTYTIPFRSTMYGGYITVGKDGEVVATATMGTVTGKEFVGYSGDTVTPSGMHYIQVDTLGCPQGASSISNMLKLDGNAWNSTTPCYQLGSTANRLRVYDYLTSLNAFKDKYADFIAVYELTTPVTVRLNPCTIRSLLGTSNIWADTGNIEELNWSADTKMYIDNLFNSIIDATGVNF